MNKTSELRTRKKAVLAELESAHVLIYQQRAQQAIRAELASQEARKADSDRERAMTIENHSIIKTNYSIIIKNKYFTEPEPKKVDPKETAIENLAFRMAQCAVGQDERLNRFRQRVDALEARGQVEDLEAILNATHNASVMIGVSAQDFLTTFEAVPEQDQVDYATATANLFRNQTGGWGENQGLSQLLMIMPRPVKGKSSLLEDNGDDWREFKIEKINNFVYNKENKRINSLHFRNREADEDKFSRLLGRRDEEEHPEFLVDLGSSLTEMALMQEIQAGYPEKGFSVSSLGLNSEGNQNRAFFGEVQEIYRQLGAEVGSNWLRHANALFGEDWSLGRDFAVKSRPTLTAYCKSLGWDLETFVRDYHSFGKPLFEVANVTTKFSAFNPERKSALVRHLVDSKDETTIRELKDARLPEPELVEGLLPEEMSVQDLIASVKRTSGLYELCNNSRVDSRLVSHRLQRAQRAENLEGYVRTLQSVEEQAKEFIAFADEQRKDPNMNLGFNDLKSQETLEIYQEVLGKNFAQFRRDFEATGTDFQKLPEIAKTYYRCLGDERLRAFLNYLTKQRNRDLINDLANPAPDDIVKTSVAKLGDAGKEDTVKALRELNKTWSFLRDVGANQILVERLSSLPNSSGGNAVIDAIAGSRRQCYSAVTGDVEVPKGLEQMIDNVVVGYYKNSGTSHGINIQPALALIASTYLQTGAEATFKAIRELEPNKKLRTQLDREGIDVEAYKTGVSRTYHVATDENSLNRVRERINAEVDQVWDRLKLLYTPKEEGNKELDKETLAKQNQLKEQVEELKQGSLREQLDKAEKFVGAYEFDDESKPLKLEVKGHIQTARSLTGTLKEMDADATFYVSKDPLESLHMGQYFGSCLSLSKNHSGCNGWASVVQTMDANKNVIYAKTEDGKYVGRNRTALTDRGVLCTRFYQNGDMNLNNAWLSYFGDFADNVGQDVMIPTTFTPTSMSSILEKMVAEGRASKESRTVSIAPAYYTAFYGDGLITRKTEDGTIQVDAEVYVLKPKVLPLMQLPQAQAKKERGFTERLRKIYRNLVSSK